MDAFRNLIRGWFGKVLLVIFLAPLVFVGLESYFFTGGQQDDDVAMTINGEKVYKAEVDKIIQAQTEQMLQLVNGDQSLINSAVIKSQVYDAFTMRTLLLQQAKKLGIEMSDEQLSALIRQQSEFLENGQFSQQKFQQYLMHSQRNINQVLADFAQQQYLSIFTYTLMNSAPYSIASQQQLLSLLTQQRTVHIATIPLAQFAQNFSATESQAQQYFNAHQQQFTRQANVDVQYVVMSKADFADKTQVTDAQIQQQYQILKQKNTKYDIRQILITTDSRSAAQAEQLANTIHQKLKAGESFEALVQQYSEDPASKAVKGKVEGYNLGVYGDTFDQAVLALSQGQTSAPVKTQYGYHLIHVDHIESLPLESVKDKLIAQVKEQNVINAFQEVISTATDVAVQTDSIEAVATQYKLPTKIAKNISLSTTDSVLSDPAVKQYIFSENIKNGERNISAALNLKNGDVAWVKVIQYRPAGLQSFAEAKPKVLQALKHQAQIQQAKQSVTKLLQDLKNKPAQQALAGSQIAFKEYHLSRFANQNLTEKLQQVAFAMTAPKANYWSVTTSDDQQSLYIVAVSKVEKVAQPPLDAQQIQQIISRFDHRGEQELNDYMEYLKSKAKIKQND